MAGSDSQRRPGQGLQRAAVPLGSIRGIKIEANWSVAVIFVLIAVGLGTLQFPSVNPHLSAATYVIAAIITAAAFFASLLAHELAHSLVALHYGLRVDKITLWILGGVSELSGDVPSPGAEVWIAGVGPLTSFVIGAVLLAATAGFAQTHPVHASLGGVFETALAYLGITNLALAVFNVIPAAPLDGGRLLRALVWWRTGDQVKATMWASRAGQAFGWVFVIGGLYAFFVTRQWTWLWFALIGWFLISAATAEAQQAVLTGQLRGIRVYQIMTPNPVTVPGSATVSDFMDNYLFRARHQAFPVTGDGSGAVTGLVTFNHIKEVPPGERGRTRLGDIACALSDVATAGPDDVVSDLLPRLTACADRRALVFSDGHLAGIISPSDIARMLDRLGVRQRPERP
jgi:Zn-dependent protease/CBS domain-containing protein